MANEKNLKPIRSKSEAKRKGKKGGKKSGESRRGKKLLKDCMELLLALPVKSEKGIKTLGNYGIKDKDMNNKMALTIALFSKAMTGDVSAAKEIRNLIGEDDDIKLQELELKKAELEFKRQLLLKNEDEIEDMDDIRNEVFGNEKNQNT